MSAMNGTEFPAALRQRLEAAGEDLDARREIAIDVATRLGEALLAAGAPGVHLYTLNFSEPARTMAGAANAEARPVMKPRRFTSASPSSSAED